MINWKSRRVGNIPLFNTTKQVSYVHGGGTIMITTSSEEYFPEAFTEGPIQ